MENSRGSKMTSWNCETWASVATKVLLVDHPSRSFRAQCAWQNGEASFISRVTDAGGSLGVEADKGGGH